MKNVFCKSKFDGKFDQGANWWPPGALKAITILAKLSLSHKGSKLVYNDWLGYRYIKIDWFYMLHLFNTVCPNYPIFSATALDAVAVILPGARPFCRSVVYVQISLN